MATTKPRPGAFPSFFVLRSLSPRNVEIHVVGGMRAHLESILTKLETFIVSHLREEGAAAPSCVRLGNDDIATGIRITVADAFHEVLVKRGTPHLRHRLMHYIMHAFPDADVIGGAA